MLIFSYPPKGDMKGTNKMQHKHDEQSKKDHIDHCIIEAVKKNDDETIEELKKAIDKMI